MNNMATGSAGGSFKSATLVEHASTNATGVMPQKQTGASRFNPLVLLKSGIGAPLFIVHGVAGVVMELFPIGKFVRSQRPAYAIQARGLDGADAPFDSLTEMASYYADSIRDVQPHGPYILAGYSFGGVVAFEMAHQLSTTGEKVALLALLDSYTHPRSWPLSCQIGVLRSRIAYRTSLAAKVPIRQTVDYYLGRLGDISRNRFRKHLRALAPLGLGDEELPEATQRVKDSCYAAWDRYRPSYYPGKITFLKAGTNWRYPDDPRTIWRNLADEFEMHTVPGEHSELVGPNAEHLANRISLCMERALEPDGSE
jgi:acetoacetyl-CoA synthetase